MTENERELQERRKTDLAGCYRWWEPEVPVMSAVNWYLDHRTKIVATPINQWEWLARLGENAQTWAEYYQQVDDGLCLLDEQGKPRVNPESKQKERRWDPGLVDDLLTAIREAAAPDKFPRRERFEQLMQNLETEEAREAANRIRERQKVEQARQFVAALVMKAKIEREDWRRPK
jgi:hypothetical protein